MSSQTAALLETIMQLPEGERLDLAMEILDRTAPPDAMTEDEITQVAMERLEELESGAVKALTYEEFVAGLRHPPRKPL